VTEEEFSLGAQFVLYQIQSGNPRVVCFIYKKALEVLVGGKVPGEGGLIDASSEGQLFIDLSTVAPETSRRVAEAAAARGAVAIDAPVSGGVSGAEAASLTIMVGAPEEAFERARPILEKIGKNIIRVGDHGAGQVAKLCNNLIVGVTMVAAAEAFAMGKASGVDPKILHEVIRTSSGGGWVVEKDPPCPGLVEGSPADRGFEAGFTVDLMLKDLSLAVSSLMALGLPCPTGAAANQIFRMASRDGLGGLDMAAVSVLLGAAEAPE
ncbi:MAG: NAD-binding protein, partial [Nitrospinota bacterium]|nr:NAD-binding protein [Nitrospinota bacterium]